MHLVGSLTRIQADPAACGPGGGATTHGTTSTGLQALSWTSTKRGITRVTGGARCGDEALRYVTGPRPAYAMGLPFSCWLANRFPHPSMPAVLECCSKGPVL